MADQHWLPGHVVWRELMTQDVDKAKGFYGELFNWTFEMMPMPTGDYTMIKAGEKFVGGLAKAPDANIPTFWNSIVSVPDVDKSVAAVGNNGGKVMAPAFDIPGVGRYAIIGDPWGAVIGLLRSEKGDTAPDGRPGLSEFCWETLGTPDIDKARSFYANVTGWKKVDGPQAEMEVFGAEDGTVVADMQKADNFPPSWTTYVVVEKLENATAKATKLGAKVLLPRLDIPNIGGIGLIQDNAGGVLGLFESSM